MRISFLLLLKIFILLLDVNEGANRCSSICYGDFRCLTGQCVLTQCIDNTACYKFCFQCDNIEDCFQGN